MKKILAAALIIIAAICLSGCFPVFVPVHDRHDHHGQHYRD